MTTTNSSKAGEKFQRLVEIMARLRSPEGCPWDRAQDFDSIKPYVLEETYEVIDAIEARYDELGHFRLVTHYWISAADVEKAARMIREALAG